MNKHRSKLGIALLSIAVLSACSSTAIEPSATQSDSGTATTTPAKTVNESVSSQAQASSDLPGKVKYEDDDYATDWTKANPTMIRLNGTAASIDGSGAEATDKSVAITAAGTYVFSGKWDEGQVVVDVPDTETVRLVLNGVNIQSVDRAPIYIKEAEKAIITLPEGTENIVSDGETYATADVSDDEPNAAVFSKADLTVNGTGKLIVHGNYNNGVTSKDDLKITGGTIEVHAADDGLMGRDLVAVKDGTITIEAGGDGIKSTNDTEQSKGNIAIEGGSFDIKAGSDGIQSAASLRIDGGTYAIVSGGGSANGTKKSGDDQKGQLGKQDTGRQAAATDSKSAKALKAASSITVNAGTFAIDSADDAVHSNGSIAIAGGELRITSGDDGIHADVSIAITGGSIDIVKSYEGIESAEITIADGDIRITASDDGVNVAGGNDGSSIGGRSGQNQFSASGSIKLVINGGSITVDAAGDGLDANGSIVMTGGNVTVNGPTASNNGSLDYDGTFELSGGFLVAAGSAGMAAAPSESSGQLSLLMKYSQSQKAGSTVVLKDGDGNVVATFAPTKAYQSVVISSPDLNKDTTYTLYSGDTKVVDFKISNAVTWLSESGVTAAGSGGRGGPGGNPGMGGGRTRP
ncbi:carbohydrate-binding domain-containing protein [Paenibacillus hemerocallicola]|uniref:Carbohydrate-binding domain-containing protein n=1 Tax=Paenibacillus hemerocallicola TaxID=1172614 RepID=A0A5C4T7E9_9BACL|nr:carbohydrate-binding domain-containing protein [Paenibacillus hemerocallicola]TNJ64219.1 carbohydrate-binding domain-containing protein [Paenibacillus hemerocallicola]